MALYAIIFLTGAAVLALELLASRIMTPYFGVSLYIWIGILSITLVALAAGYWAGGKIAAGRSGKPRPVEQLAFLYALMPALAALAVVAACLAYPFLFRPLAQADLVLGAFAACLVLLFVPLVATSAMNPLLVAILLRGAGASAADAGAGRVFFVSTIGSVAGVFATAFFLIPHLSNFASTLVVAVALAALPLVLLARPPLPLVARRTVAATAGAALVLAVTLLVLGDRYIGQLWPAQYGGREWTRETAFRSHFGTVQILRSAPAADGSFRRLYFQDGITQNSVAHDGRSLSMYTYALDALARAHAPAMRSALVLGLGAGIVPMRFAERGLAVTAIDIDPASARAATEVFGFRPDRVTMVIEDARTYLRHCRSGYDVVVVDLFHGDGVPDYLVTRDFFRDLRKCLGRGGVAVFNTFADLEHPRPYAHFLATLRAELPHVVVYRPDYAGFAQINSFVVAAASPLAPPVPVAVDDAPDIHALTLRDMLRNPRPLDAVLLAHGEIITDSRNTVAEDIARGQLHHRQSVVRNVPPAFLVN